MHNYGSVDCKRQPQKRIFMATWSCGTASRQDASQPCYIGEDTPKMLLLVNAARPQAPETFVVEATAFPGAMRFGQLLGACQSAWPYSQVPADPEFHVELRDGQAILNIGGYHCQQEGCLTCFLTNCAQLPQCPWHAPQDTKEDRLPLSFSHFICTKDPSTSIVEFVGQLKEGPTDGIIQVFHVCTNEQLRDMSLHRHVTPSKVSLFHSSLSEANTTEDQFQQLVQPFQHVELPRDLSTSFCSSWWPGLLTGCLAPRKEP